LPINIKALKFLPNQPTTNSCVAPASESQSDVQALGWRLAPQLKFTASLPHPPTLLLSSVYFILLDIHINARARPTPTSPTATWTDMISAPSLRTMEEPYNHSPCNNPSRAHYIKKEKSGLTTSSPVLQ